MKQRYREFEISVKDDNNYIVHRVSAVKEGENIGKETLAIVGYFGSIGTAVERIATLCANEAPDLKAWLAEYKNVRADIEGIVT